MKIAVVCKYGVFRSQILAAFLRKYKIGAEAYGLLDKYKGKKVGEISKEIFYRLEKKFNISFTDKVVKQLDKGIIENYDLIITFDEKLKKKIIERFDNKEKIFSLKELIGIEVEDLKDKSYDEHEKFVKVIRENLITIIEKLRNRT